SKSIPPPQTHKSFAHTPAPSRNYADSRPGVSFPPETAAAVAKPKATSQQTQSLDASAQNRVNPAKLTRQNPPAVQPANTPTSVNVTPDISPVALPAVVPPAKPISTSPAPAGNIQTQVPAETKP
ncbi:MAG: hypothetical protein AAB278_07500, partial [Pseudomonadota bacterium]